MFTLDTDRLKEDAACETCGEVSAARDNAAERPAHLGTGMKYLTASLVIAAAAAVYGLFSHGVYSYYMTYAFMIPLLLGAMPHLIAAYKGTDLPKRLGGDLQLAVIATLTAGSLLKGALDIYGTTNRLLWAYPVIAAVTVAAGMAIGVTADKKSSRPVSEGREG